MTQPPERQRLNDEARQVLDLLPLLNKRMAACPCLQGNGGTALAVHYESISMALRSRLVVRLIRSSTGNGVDVLTFEDREPLLALRQLVDWLALTLERRHESPQRELAALLESTERTLRLPSLDQRLVRACAELRDQEEKQRILVARLGSGTSSVAATATTKKKAKKR